MDALAVDPHASNRVYIATGVGIVLESVLHVDVEHDTLLDVHQLMGS